MCWYTFFPSFKPENAESLFKALPSTPIVLQFASLYYSIKLFIHIGVPLLSSDNEVDLDPSSIIRRVIYIYILYYYYPQKWIYVSLIFLLVMLSYRAWDISHNNYFFLRKCRCGMRVRNILLEEGSVIKLSENE